MTGEFVLDASVAVKWLREEPGSDEALGLLAAHLEGAGRIWLPEHCVTELLAVARRDLGAGALTQVWRLIADSGLSVVPLSSELVDQAQTQCEQLGCSFYDALAPALSVLVEATLVSADARAHRLVPGVRLLG